ncbi:MAG: sulfite exporter TauE/SafE family protein [Chthonomonas sp.]|nr:sulfite exporter TauE/SafE family protein [Chthonomonas sp.]
MEIILGLIIGLFAGVGGGLFGIGGGIIIVPCLTFALGFTQHKAQGTSLVALLMPVGILGLMNYAKAQNVDYKIGALIAAGFLGGALLGSKLALGLSPIVMKRCFAGFLFVVASYMLYTTKSPA